MGMFLRPPNLEERRMSRFCAATKTSAQLLYFLYYMMKCLVVCNRTFLHTLMSQNTDDDICMHRLMKMFL